MAKRFGRNHRRLTVSLFVSEKGINMPHRKSNSADKFAGFDNDALVKARNEIINYAKIMIGDTAMGPEAVMIVLLEAAVISGYRVVGDNLGARAGYMQAAHESLSVLGIQFLTRPAAGL